MKYRAKITNIVPQIRNISKYATRYICRDTKDLYIEVDTEEEVELIEELNYTYQKAFAIYNELIEKTH